jgi:glucokinase
MILGIDIGGTKCAVTLGEGGKILKKESFPTENCKQTITKLLDLSEKMGKAEAVGISCGGPLDSDRGIIMSPPNLPGWDDVPITSLFEERLKIPAYLQNDANACALAEWRFGAGRGCKNMAFLTFGTGLGAGLILNGALVGGANGMAGEIGHVRLTDDGPVGYGKAGSAEGYCSGGGIARLGQSFAKEHLLKGGTLPYCKNEGELSKITAKLLAEYARAGEPLAKRVYDLSGEMLGRTLSVIIDFINPEKIVIGSIFARAEDLLRPNMEKILKKEAIPLSLSVCDIVRAELGEEIGDLAALAVGETRGGKQGG